MTSTSFIATLSNRCVISISGEQSAEYLHGQLTVSTKAFDKSRARFAAHCDFKGKMFSTMFVTHANGSFLLSMLDGAAQETQAQLKKYGVFSKVDISARDDLTIIGLSGSEALDALKTLFPSLSNEHMSVYANDNGQAICFNDTSLRYLCYLSEDALANLKEAWAKDLETNNAYFDRLEIEAGVAQIGAESIGQYVPQMLNLQSLAGIDFDKGCYMGQEVVARTKFLGKNKRASYIIKGSVPRECTAKPGDTLEVKLGDNWRRGGTLLQVSVLPNNEGENACLIALAVMANDTEAGSMLRLKDTEHSLTVIDVPYELD